MSTDRYVSPLSERYASKEMQYIFSPDMKFRTWRRLWIALAETEKELGLNITQEQIDELKSHADDINYDVAKDRCLVRHDVMSHVYAYGVQCPKAKGGTIHLGATSCYVGDNTDIIVMAEALKLVRKKLVNVIAELSKFAENRRPANTGIYSFPAWPANDGRKKSNTLDTGVSDGSGGFGICIRHTEASGLQRYNRNTGKLWNRLTEIRKLLTIFLIP